jgi:UDP-N-acetylmuramoyl-L-alanyl-D-glutamate--2,6-diaminopimelate ligase
VTPWKESQGRLDYSYMKLSKLIREFPYPHDPVSADPEITGVASDSRMVKPGNLFVALIGGSTDGHLYIPEAVKQGAAAIVGCLPIQGLHIPYLQVQDSRKALPHLVAAFYGFPGRNLTVIGVTGTDGKTTTTNLIYSILRQAGYKCGMISTINAVIGDQILDTGFHVTTPDAPDVQRYLAQMVNAGLTHVVLEVTSHGLAQYRVDACEFDIAVITNITHEHLDYHGSFESYRSAKARLFTSLNSTLAKAKGNFRLAILNRDDASYDYLSQVSTGSILSYGFHPEADIRPDDIRYKKDGLEFEVVGMDRKFSCQCSLLGDFNISNCLAAITATVYALKVDHIPAQAGISSVKVIPGRMESISLGQDFTAIVDFAHTPNALKIALETARKHTHNKVIAVFGAAGLRDRQKRRMMAEISHELANISILTAEDPRTESLEEILAEMAAGAISKGGIEGESFWRIPDRGEAIRFAISQAASGDVVISCGKGHEQSMCFGDIEYAWDDRTAMRAALSQHLGIPGPHMPYLPTQDSL